MAESASDKNKRIAKNTLLLYIRTFCTMLISLFTSRLILETLGVDNFGIYNVVGGFVGMFSIISGSLSGSISRYLTYGLGKGDLNHLKVVFSTSVNVQLILSGVIILIGETIGLWFLNYHLNIPPERMFAAHWVLQCSIFSFVIGLLSAPYNACIVAHEKMNVFAYMTILDVILKLLFVYALFVTPFDKLITYAVSLLFINTLMRFIYGFYCKHKFEECSYKFILDKKILKEMTGFAWWNFFGNTAYIFNTQGVNMAINIFFGVAFNAARGIVGQVEGAVISLVSNFTTAFTPQITKSYAEGNKDYMFSVICRGSKFSFLLLWLIVVPLEIEAPTLLKLWLKTVPEDTVLFLRLSLFCNLIMQLGGPCYTAIMATGNIRNYQIAVTVVGCLVFPLTLLAYHLGSGAQATYYIYFAIYLILVFIRLYFMKKLLGFEPKLFLRNSMLPLIPIILLSFIAPLGFTLIMDEGIVRLVSVTIISIIWNIPIIYFFGLSISEKEKVRLLVFKRVGLCH